VFNVYIGQLYLYLIYISIDLKLFITVCFVHYLFIKNEKLNIILQY